MLNIKSVSLALNRYSNKLYSIVIHSKPTSLTQNLPVSLNDFSRDVSQTLICLQKLISYDADWPRKPRRKIFPVKHELRLDFLTDF